MSGDDRLTWSYVEGCGAASIRAYQVTGLACRAEVGTQLAGGGYLVESRFLNHTSLVQGYTHVDLIVPWVRDIGAYHLVLALVRAVDRGGTPVGGAGVAAEWTLPGGLKRAGSGSTNWNGLALFYRFAWLSGTCTICDRTAQRRLGA